MSPTAPKIMRAAHMIFSEHWGDPEAANKKFLGDWLITGDEGEAGLDGYPRYVGRTGDIITSTGKVIRIALR